MHLTLEQLRYQREVAMHHNLFAQAFALATAIDRKRGLYK